MTAETEMQAYSAFGDLDVGDRFIPSRPGTDLHGTQLYGPDGAPRILIKIRQLKESQRPLMRPSDTYNAAVHGAAEPQTFALDNDHQVIPLGSKPRTP